MQLFGINPWVKDAFRLSEVFLSFIINETHISLINTGYKHLNEVFMFFRIWLNLIHINKSFRYEFRFVIYFITYWWNCSMWYHESWLCVYAVVPQRLYVTPNAAASRMTSNLNGLKSNSGYGLTAKPWTHHWNDEVCLHTDLKYFKCRICTILLIENFNAINRQFIV